MPEWSHRRREDHRLLIGSGRFVSDLTEPDDLHVHFQRSPIAHGWITSVDAEAAAGMTGTRLVLTASDLSLPPIASGPLSVDGLDRPLLAEAKVRYAGEPVAAVVSVDAASAADAAGSIWVDIEPLPVVARPEDARDGVALFGAGNVVATRTAGSQMSERVFEKSATVTVRNQRLAPAPLEGLAIRAAPTAEGGLTVHCGHQAPHRLRMQLAEQLDLHPGQVRVIVPDVGGAFGLKGMLFPEYIVTCFAALHLGRPVVWIEERREHFLGGVHGRGQIHEITLEGDADGRIRRASIRILADVGAYPHNGALIPGLSTYVAQGLYDFEELSVEATTVVTNLAPTGSYRGAGRPEAAFAIERAIDVFARSLAMDPAEVRLKNFVRRDQMPYTTHTGARYDSGDYAATLEMALEMIDRPGFERERSRRVDLDLDPIGLGISAFVERSGGALGSGEYGEVGVEDDGTIVVRTGSTSAGQGHETVWADVAAGLFGVRTEQVMVLAGDTGEVADGVGTFGSRSAQIGASAIQRTGTIVVDRAKTVAAAMLEASAADLVVAGGRVHVTGDPGSGVSLGEIAALAGAEGAPLQAAEMFVPDNQAFPFGAHVAVVEVLLETGEVRLVRYVAVDDCGVILNPMIVEGQVIGSLAQGFGQAVLEGIEYGEEADPLTTSFMDYLIPAALDVPDFALGRTVSPAPSNPLGAKGAGEAGCIGAPPAIVNAVLDALAPLGVEHVDMPLRPHKVWAAIRSARR
ncbi:MAG: xanthine dehydrogenase family protein molybdopterin-binding subunit [Acidimicrobiia bacterium]